MTYLQFHLVFILPMIVAFGWLSFRAVRAGQPVAGMLGGPDRAAWVTLAAHVVVALLYTTPWDNHLVARGIWGYPEGRVWFTLGWVPIEEYLFFVLQTIMTGLILFAAARHLRPSGRRDDDVLGDDVLGDPDVAGSRAIVRVAGAATLATIAGMAAVALRFDSGVYLGLILVWAAPVLALQWVFGGDLLAERWRLLVVAVALPTLWLWVADRIAIAQDIWWISDVYTTGLTLLGLPVEEAMFFLATNLLVVFGVTMVLHPASWRRWNRLRSAVAATRGLAWKAVLVLWALSMIPVPWAPGAFPAFAWASSLLLALGTLLYAQQRFGARAYLLFAIAFTFGVLVEAIGSATGIPFGSYEYSAPGPALLGVPLLVPLGWWAFTMVAIAAAPGRAFWAATPLVLVAWDLGLDPLMVHHGFWRFEPPGVYAGVPLVNFAGWYVAGLVEPDVKRASGGPLRAVFVTQAFFLVFGLAYFGLGGAALVTAGAMGAVVISWRWPEPQVARAQGVE